MLLCKMLVCCVLRPIDSELQGHFETAPPFTVSCKEHTCKMSLSKNIIHVQVNNPKVFVFGQ